MYQTTSNAIEGDDVREPGSVRTARALVRSGAAALTGGAATAALARASADRWAARIDLAAPLTPRGLEDLVVAVVTGVGALVAAALTAGCLLLVVSLVAQSAGHAATAVERLSARLTPQVLRRVLVLGVGGVLVAGPAAATGSAPGTPELDLGWSTSASTGGSTTTDAAATQGAGPGLAAGAPAALTSSPATGGQPAAAPRPSVPPDPSDLPDPPDPSDPSSVAERAVHVVQPGDSLWAIAEAYLGAGAVDADVAAAWPRWYAANADLIGPDPDLVLPGQALVAPTAAVTSSEEQP